MEAVREAWTDELLDDLAHRMDRGFDRVDTDIRELRSEMSSRFDAMQRTMILTLGTIVAGFLGIIVTQL